MEVQRIPSTNPVLPDASLVPNFAPCEKIRKLVRQLTDIAKNKKPIICIAGVIGKTKQAVDEAELALQAGYHAVLHSVAAFVDASNREILEHCRTVAKIIPVIGFYLQPAVGGRILDVNFWREFAQI